METTNTHFCTKWSRYQPPHRKLGTIPGTDASIRRNTIYTNWVWGVATGRGSPTKRVTTTVGKPQLMDQMRAGALHQKAVYRTREKTKECDKTPREKTVTSEECIPNRFPFCYMKVPIEFCFAQKHRVPQRENISFRDYSVPSATIVRMFSNYRTYAHVHFRSIFIQA